MEFEESSYLQYLKDAGCDNNLIEQVMILLNNVKIDEIFVLLYEHRKAFWSVII